MQQFDSKTSFIGRFTESAVVTIWRKQLEEERKKMYTSLKLISAPRLKQTQDNIRERVDAKSTKGEGVRRHETRCQQTTWTQSYRKHTATASGQNLGSSEAPGAGWWGEQTFESFFT